MTMKQIYFVLIISPLLFSCTQTKEEKAAEIAKSEMIKILYNVDIAMSLSKHR